MPRIIATYFNLLHLISPNHITEFNACRYVAPGLNKNSMDDPGATVQ